MIVKPKVRMKERGKGVLPYLFCCLLILVYWPGFGCVTAVMDRAGFAKIFKGTERA